MMSVDLVRADLDRPGSRIEGRQAIKAVKPLRLSYQHLTLLLQVLREESRRCWLLAA